ncbi:MAG: hypothetical protein JWQ89_4354 [Devosia sp.]|uniref:hypothetical protein n=1 Tax=Devosia sp. TaxID=1871048 RepID=UPI002622B209|nr:hypothetical protein [Devosia sp.]MDB5542627.1 hypothetical protein [Devosia sp.]
MRRLFLLIFALLTAPALAEDWGSYENARFGYMIDVPPGFSWGKEADNGDGRSFRSGATRLSVWGGNIVEPSFEGQVEAAMGLSAADGWAITYHAVTPSWAGYSGSQAKRILYQRMIALCDGAYAAFRLEYSAVEIGKLELVVDRLVKSLKGDC